MSKLTLGGANPVSQTLLIPLWARALEQREPEPLVRDPLSAQMVERIDYDWRQIRLSRGDLVQCVVRLREFDRFVRDFLTRNPAGTVVHMGCGLDPRFQRVDNGEVRWFDLDLPDVIALRRQLLSESGRDRYLACSVFEPGWMDELGRSDGESVLFVAEAMLPYFHHWQVRDLVVRLRQRFPGAELVSDMCTPLARRIDNVHLLVTRSAARMHWAVSDPVDLEAWSRGIRLLESFYYFEDPEPRMGLPSWFGRVPLLSRATSIQRYQLGTAPTGSRADHDRPPTVEAAPEAAECRVPRPRRGRACGALGSKDRLCEEVDMDPTILGTEDAFVPDPEDWPTADHSGRSPEATENEADDLASSLPAGTGIPIEADEADVADQRQVLDLDEDDELRTD